MTSSSGLPARLLHLIANVPLVFAENDLVVGGRVNSDDHSQQWYRMTLLDDVLVSPTAAIDGRLRSGVNMSSGTRAANVSARGDK